MCLWTLSGDMQTVSFSVANGEIYQPQDWGAFRFIIFVCKQTGGYCQRKAP